MESCYGGFADQGCGSQCNEMGLIEKNVGGGGAAREPVSLLETLPDDVIQKLRKREFKSGEIIGGRYRLKSLIGVGAMGQVFVAENLATGVDVAVKLLKAELIASAEFRQRFQKEAEAVASISHQNVARFFDLFVGDPTFLVVEYVNGPTLQQLIEQEERVPYERAIRIAVRLCWGLEAAHARGIVHRDLKPANIIVAHDLEVRDQPKIIDFGLAKLATTTQTAQLTRTGQILGTPEYMAPEQIEGKPIDARADVYALGCVLYKMIAGHSPFAGDDDVQVMYRQLHSKPQPLAERVHGIPATLDEVLARALAKRPADRYRDTRELAHALNRISERRHDSGGLGTDAVAVGPKQPPLWLLAASMVAVGAVAGALLARATQREPTPVAAAQAVAGPTSTALLVIASTPAGAAIELDGKPLPDVTPAALHALEPGPHTIRLSSPGHSTVERKVSTAREGRASLVVSLPPAQRNVLVGSVPSGAMVYLDGNLVGPAPATVIVNEDDFHELRLEKLGFATLVRPIKPDDTETELSLSLELDPHPRSEVQVDSSAAAAIWLDGVDTGLETPAVGMRVAPGRHTLQLRDSSGAVSKTTTIHVRPGQTLRIVMNL